jgi:hypothetical protein
MNKITLTINKRKLDFHFGLFFIGEALDTLDLSIDDIGVNLSKNPFKLVPELMYISASYGLRRKGKEIDFTKDEFFDWLDNDGGFSNGNLGKFLDAFTKSLTLDVPKGDDTGVESKKK